MFSDGHLDETSQPWWRNYFTKAQELGMTKETNIERFQNPVSRYELALILYRFKKIYADDAPVTSLIQTGTTNNTTGTIVATTTGTVTPTTTGDNTLLSLIG